MVVVVVKEVRAPTVKAAVVKATASAGVFVPRRGYQFLVRGTKNKQSAIVKYILTKYIN